MKYCHLMYFFEICWNTEHIYPFHTSNSWCFVKGLFDRNIQKKILIFHFVPLFHIHEFSFQPSQFYNIVRRTTYHFNCEGHKCNSAIMSHICPIFKHIQKFFWVVISIVNTHVCSLSGVTESKYIFWVMPPVSLIKPINRLKSP